MPFRVVPIQLILYPLRLVHLHLSDHKWDQFLAPKYPKLWLPPQHLRDLCQWLTHLLFKDLGWAHCNPPVLHSQHQYNQLQHLLLPHQLCRLLIHQMYLVITSFLLANINHVYVRFWRYSSHRMHLPYGFGLLQHQGLRSKILSNDYLNIFTLLPH